MKKKFIGKGILKKEQAERYGKEIDRLTKEHGFVTPKILVEEASSKKSPLHDWFEWNKNKAAEKWLIEQAKYLLRSIEVVVVCEGKPVQTRYMVNVANEEVASVYMPIQAVLEDEKLMDDYVAQAFRELESVRSKYEHLLELRELWEKLDEIKEKVSIVA